MMLGVLLSCFYEESKRPFAMLQKRNVLDACDRDHVNFVYKV